MDKIGDETECCKSLRQVPFSMFPKRNADPEALKSMEFDINMAVISPKCPENVNNDVEF